ncbi:MAG: hypothetical protein ACRDP3_16860, partial [Streptomyces sp.]
MQSVAASFGVPAETLASLARTRPGPEDLRLLRAGLYSRRLVLLKSLLAQADRHAVPPPVRQRLNRHWRLLERAEAADPLAAREALSYPSVGNWLVHALSVPARDRPAFEDCLGGLGALAAAVALRTGVSFRITLPAPGGRLTLPGIGVYATHATHAGTETHATSACPAAHAARVRVVAGPRSLRLTPEHRRTGIELRPPYGHATGAGWHGLRPLPGSPAVLDDLD